jgi:hypothetical protein
MSNLVQRMGWVRIRVGGNSQEDAELRDPTYLESIGLAPGAILAKDKENVNNPTGTPPLDYTDDLFHLMNAISDLTNVRWYLGAFYTIFYELWSRTKHRHSVFQHYPC